MSRVSLAAWGVLAPSLMACDPRALIPPAWIEPHACELLNTCCEADTECSSQLCNPHSNPLPIIDPADAAPGECVPSTRVAVVDNRPNTYGERFCISGRSPDGSFCEVDDALSRLPIPRYILLKFSPEPYRQARGFRDLTGHHEITILGQATADSPTLQGVLLGTESTITMSKILLVHNPTSATSDSTVQCLPGTRLKLIDSAFFPPPICRQLPIDSACTTEGAEKVFCMPPPLP